VLKISGLLAFALLLGSTASLAIDRSDFWTPYNPHIPHGQLFNRADHWPDGARSRLVPLPEPGSHGPQGASGANNQRQTQRGPIASRPVDSLADTLSGAKGFGGALASPGGGSSIYSSKQRADRQIAQLIRRLN